MINRFDNSIKNKYGLEHLKSICNANMKLVPEKIITSMIAAISLECFPADKDSCHHFLGWDIEKFAFYKLQGIPLNILFETMKQTFQPSCSTVCINPNVHFKEFSTENRCFPIEKVFNVFRQISNNAANKLLDPSLVEAVHQQIKIKESKKLLKVYLIPVKPISGLSRFFKRRKDFRMLLVNFDILTIDEDELLKDEEYKAQYDNLLDNLQKNFSFSILKRPVGENPVVWQNHLDLQFTNVNIFVVLLSDSNLNCIEQCQSIGMKKDIDSLNSASQDENFSKFETNLLDDDIKYQNFVWKKLSDSDKLKIAVTFNPNKISNISKCFPMAYVLPKEMLNFLVLIDKIKTS